MAHKREANVCRKRSLCDDCCIRDPDASTIMACGVNERLLHSLTLVSRKVGRGSLAVLHAPQQKPEGFALADFVCELLCTGCNWRGLDGRDDMVSPS